MCPKSRSKLKNFVDVDFPGKKEGRKEEGDDDVTRVLTEKK